MREYPSCPATELMYRVRLKGYHNSAGRPNAEGFWQAILITHAFASSVISILRPRPLLSSNAVFTPDSLYFFRQSFTVGLEISSLSAMASSAMPSDFNKRILALLWTLASTVPFCRTDFKYDLSSSERKIGVALFGIFYLLKWSISIIPFQNNNVNLFESNYTSRRNR